MSKYNKTNGFNIKTKIKEHVVNALHTFPLFVNNVILLKSLVFKQTYLYICSNSTRSTSLKNSKRVLFSESYITKDNTPSRLTKVAHLGGLFFHKSLVG